MLNEVKWKDLLLSFGSGFKRNKGVPQNEQ